ncbi:hypothetical protein FB45DRAFT_858895 [Roridomyces roridus]|uniref:Uncharacterized protein n=1 Tax=Roridomyces roridus TaxID=1738132 RepID=A0AAD7CJ03_9AGAR|nr:hypothetical protein FB45DRAFT_858895 [Roridomyces roridus]
MSLKLSRAPRWGTSDKERCCHSHPAHPKKLKDACLDPVRPKECRYRSGFGPIRRSTFLENFRKKHEREVRQGKGFRIVTIASGLRLPFSSFLNGRTPTNAVIGDAFENPLLEGLSSRQAGVIADMASEQWVSHAMVQNRIEIYGKCVSEQLDKVHNRLDHITDSLAQWSTVFP